MTETVHQRPQTASTTRTEAFSDGVFAIAATLLVIEIGVPSPAAVEEAGGLLNALLDAWPAYLSYAATFGSIAVIWLNHHAFFARLTSLDGPLQWSNLLLLMVVAFLPFANALIADFLREDLWDGSARTAAAAYAFVFTLATVPWLFMWSRLMSHPELLKPGFDTSFARRERRRAIVGVVGYAASILVAYAAPVVAVVLFLLAAVFFALTARGWRAHSAGPSEASS